MTRAVDYEDALRQLGDGKIAAPVYYIIAGSQSNQAAVLTRNRDNLEDLWPVDITQNWYLLETNYVRGEHRAVDIMRLNINIGSLEISRPLGQ